MENQTYPAWKHAFMYGVYIGVVLIILSLIIYVLNLFIEKWPGYISYAVLLGGIIISTIVYRNKYLKGFISYSKSFSVGFQVGLITTIIFGIFTFIYMTFLGEEYRSLKMIKAEEKILEFKPDISDYELAKSLEIPKFLYGPLGSTIKVLFLYILFSTLFTLIGSIFVKKEHDKNNN